jgi:hypothetical protein
MILYHRRDPALRRSGAVLATTPIRLLRQRAGDGRQGTGGAMVHRRRHPSAAAAGRMIIAGLLGKY